MRIPKRRYDKIYQRPDPHISEVKFNELKNKLDRLKNHSRFQAMAEVARLAEMGDFSENHEYQIAKGRLRGINARILELADYLKHVVIIQPQSNKDKINLGDSVTIKFKGQEKTYQLLGPLEADPFKNIISHQSPLGSCLINRRVGDKFTTHITNQPAEIEILKIE